MTKTGKIILGVAGGLFLVLLIFVSFGVWMIRSAFQSEEVDQVEGDGRLRGGPAAVQRHPAGVRDSRRPAGGAAHAAGDPGRAGAGNGPHPGLGSRPRAACSRISLPFSLLRLSNDPIEMDGMELQVEDVERYGRTLLLDGDTPEGDHMLVWTD